MEQRVDSGDKTLDSSNILIFLTLHVGVRQQKTVMSKSSTLVVYNLSNYALAILVDPVEFIH